MPDILHRFTVAAPPERVAEMLLTPEGLNAWWTETARGRAARGARYDFGFGPQYQWAGTLVELEPGRKVVWEMVDADDDWRGTRVGCTLEPSGAGTTVDFFHTGWREANDHYRRTSYCWAMYLRLLKRHVEAGELVPYERRYAA